MFKFLNSSKRSLQDQLVLFGCGLPIFFLLPFTLYRLINQDYAIAAIDFMITAGLMTIFYQTWKGKKNNYLNAIAVFSFMAGVSWVMSMKGLSLVFWAFPTMGFTYFVLRSRDALIANALFITGITFIFFNTLNKSQALSIYPSLLLVCLFGYAFSLCSERQNKKLLKRVSTDTLTGVKNRRSFDEKVERILANHKRHPKPVSMLLLDLDNFKNINDTYGHKKGDDILTEFAQTVKSIIRTTDYVYRFGGEEFVVIANNSSLENSGVLAESIREFIIQSPSLSEYNITVSIGVAEIIKNDDADSWFRRADRALYESKATGRNRVTLAKYDELGHALNQISEEDKKIKSIPTKTHSIIRSRDSVKSTHVEKQNKRSISVLNISE